MFSTIHPAPRRSSPPGLCSTSHAHPPPTAPPPSNLSSIPSAPAVFPTRQFPRDHTDDTSSSCALYPNNSRSSFSPPPPIILSESHTIVRALALASLCLPRSSCTTTLCVFRCSPYEISFYVLAANPSSLPICAC
jgi:hypothetical protein